MTRDPRLNPAPTLEQLTEEMGAELGRQIEALDAKGWVFHLIGTAAVAVQLAAMAGRTLKDPAASEDGKAVARFLIPWLAGFFREHSPYIYMMLERAFPELVTGPQNGGPNAARRRI